MKHAQLLQVAVDFAYGLDYLLDLIVSVELSVICNVYIKMH